MNKTNENVAEVKNLYTTVVRHEVMPGDKVMVKNYRISDKYDQWELSTVLQIEASICSRVTLLRKGPAYHLQYRVRLDRKSGRDNYIFLYVDEKSIKAIE